MKTVAVIQARMTSSRLPGKVLLPLGSGTILDAVVRRMSNAAGIDAICVAIPEGPAHDPIERALHKEQRISVFRGSEHDVLSRFLLAARETDASYVVRVTSDCPLIDPRTVSAVVAAGKAAGVAYASTALDSGYPTGFDVECIRRDALETAGAEADDNYEREHVTPFIWRRPERFAALYLDRIPNIRSMRLVVDTPEDYLLAQTIWQHLGHDPLFGLNELLALRDRNPEIFRINAHVPQTEYIGLPANS